MYFNAPQLVHTMGKGETVRGVTCLGDEVFIVCDGKAEVQVFSVDTFTLKRCLPVIGLSNAWDLASCAQNYNLYGINYNGNDVFKVDIRGNATNSSSWTVNGATYTLSVTDKPSVLVSIYNTSKLKEFTGDGRLIREIDVSQIAPGPFHSVQLSNNQFLVSSNSGAQRLHVIDEDGKLVQSHSSQTESAIGQVQDLSHLIVDKQGFIAAADYSNNKVLLFSPSLTYVRELISADKGLPKEPIRMHFDEKRRLLFVVGFKDGHLSVFGGKTGTG